jgi:hypothetical protein
MLKELAVSETSIPNVSKTFVKLIKISSSGSYSDIWWNSFDINDELYIIKLNSVNDIHELGYKYACISYKWGDVDFWSCKIHETEVSIDLSSDNKEVANKTEDGCITNIVAFSKESLKISIEACKSLGFNYMWIDAICINQQDKDDLTNGMSMMTQLYTDCAKKYNGVIGIPDLGVAYNDLSGYKYIYSKPDIGSIKRIDEILFRGWFRRAWVKGEIMSSIKQLNDDGKISHKFTINLFFAYKCLPYPLKPGYLCARAFVDINDYKSYVDELIPIAIENYFVESLAALACELRRAKCRHPEEVFYSIIEYSFLKKYVDEFSEEEKEFMKVKDARYLGWHLFMLFAPRLSSQDLITLFIYCCTTLYDDKLRQYVNFYLGRAANEDLSLINKRELYYEVALNIEGNINRYDSVLGNRYDFVVESENKNKFIMIHDIIKVEGDILELSFKSNDKLVNIELVNTASVNFNPKRESINNRNCHSKISYSDYMEAIKIKYFKLLIRCPCEKCISKRRAHVV